MLLHDTEIRNYCTNPLYHGDFGPMIEPFSEAVSGEGVISFGLTSAGYDLRLGPTLLVFKNSYGEAIDAKKFRDPGYMGRMFDRVEGKPGQGIVIPAHSYVLACSHEYLRIPKSFKGRVVGKSTLARCGLVVNTTPLEPEWQGHLTIEIANTAPCPNTIWVGEGIGQIEFEVLMAVPEMTYAQKQGQYDRQRAFPVAAKVK